MAIDVCGKCRETEYIFSKPTPLKQTQLQTFDSILFSNIGVLAAALAPTAIAGISIAVLLKSASMLSFIFIFTDVLPSQIVRYTLFACVN